VPHVIATCKNRRGCQRRDQVDTLRLREVGMIKSSPNAILAEGTDWRFLNEIKRELKA
jgi:hypothetical protein